MTIDFGEMSDIPKTTSAGLYWMSCFQNFVFFAIYNRSFFLA